MTLSGGDVGCSLKKWIGVVMYLNMINKFSMLISLYKGKWYLCVSIRVEEFGQNKCNVLSLKLNAVSRNMLC